MVPTLMVRAPEPNSVKAKAVEDARQMQARVLEECKKAGKDPPPYGLEELIGKGSFGRVYKGKDMKSAATVAVKIIDIDESDTVNPRQADSYSEFLKEVGALKILSESKAKNINHVIAAVPVGQSMWMITEHCGGGSVATLMKPTAPGGLQEKWIIPILREVAEALKWVHQVGIIHRDVKCANVLITEQGGVQLCDFGVAGIVESKIDKRSTIIGTPHWMAPELFESAPSYGKEVDIWAFGAMIYEIATGLPPNVANGVSFDRLGSYLKQHVPRLEGGNFTYNLKSLVAFCLEENPKSRPTIEQVQKHAYITKTDTNFPTSGLRALVGSFRVWESRGGSRKSLFFQHGAQNALQSFSPLDDEWNFSTTEVFEKSIALEFSARDVYDAYGPAVVDFDEETTRPPRGPSKPSRRRPPPEALGRFPAQPLEKIFDPNTMSNYDDNSRALYGRAGPPQSDLPLRDNSAQISIKDTMIDLGGHDIDTGLSSFSHMDTIKANRHRDEGGDDYQPEYSRPALSDPTDPNPNRRTQDWKFPSITAPPASADPEISRFPVSSFDLPRPIVTPQSGGRPALIHHPTEPTFGAALMASNQTAPDRLSMQSLIDLDMSLPDPAQEIRRPSTANSEAGSATSEQMSSTNPFEYDRHASVQGPIATREPSIYITEDAPIMSRPRGLQEMLDISDFSASDAEGPPNTNGRHHSSQYRSSIEDDAEDIPRLYQRRLSGDPSRRFDNESVDQSRDPFRPSDTIMRGVNGDGELELNYAPMPQTRRPSGEASGFSSSNFLTTNPQLPQPPSRSVLTGNASSQEMQSELTRVLHGMQAQMDAFRATYNRPYAPLPSRNSSLGRGSNNRYGEEDLYGLNRNGSGRNVANSEGASGTK